MCPQLSVPGVNARVDIRIVSPHINQAITQGDFILSNSPRWTDPLHAGLPILRGVQGHDDEYMTMDTLS